MSILSNAVSGATGGVTFTPNPFFEGELLRSGMLDDDLMEAAEAIASAARGLAPVDEGDYRDSITAEVGQGDKGVEGNVFSEDYKAGFVEFGTIHNPAYAPLRRGAEQAGYSVSGT